MKALLAAMLLTLSPTFAAESGETGVEWLRNCLSTANAETRRTQAISACTSNVFHVCEHLDARGECADRVEAYARRETDKIMETVLRESGDTEGAQYLYQKLISIVEQDEHLPVCDEAKIGFPGCSALHALFKYQVAIGLKNRIEQE